MSKQSVQLTSLSNNSTNILDKGKQPAASHALDNKDLEGNKKAEEVVKTNAKAHSNLKRLIADVIPVNTRVNEEVEKVEKVNSLIEQNGDISAKDSNTVMLFVYQVLNDKDIKGDKEGIAIDLVHWWYVLGNPLVTPSDHEYLEVAIKECNWVVLFILSKLGKIEIKHLGGLMGDQEINNVKEIKNVKEINNVKEIKNVLTSNPLLNAYLKDKVKILKQQDALKECLKSMSPKLHGYLKDKVEVLNLQNESKKCLESKFQRHTYLADKEEISKQWNELARCLKSDTIEVQRDVLKRFLEYMSTLLDAYLKDRGDILSQQNAFKECLKSKPQIHAYLLEKDKVKRLLQDDQKLSLESNSIEYHKTKILNWLKGYKHLESKSLEDQTKIRDQLGHFEPCLTSMYTILDAYLKDKVEILKQQNALNECLESMPLLDAYPPEEGEVLKPYMDLKECLKSKGLLHAYTRDIDRILKQQKDPKSMSTALDKFPEDTAKILEQQKSFNVQLQDDVNILYQQKDFIKHIQSKDVLVEYLKAEGKIFQQQNALKESIPAFDAHARGEILEQQNALKAFLKSEDLRAFARDNDEILQQQDVLIKFFESKVLYGVFKERNDSEKCLKQLEYLKDDKLVPALKEQHALKECLKYIPLIDVCFKAQNARTNVEECFISGGYLRMTTTSKKTLDLEAERNTILFLVDGPKEITPTQNNGLASGAKNSVDLDKTRLHIAVNGGKSGDLSMIKYAHYYLDAYSSKKYVNLNPVLSALQHKQLDCVKWMIENVHINMSSFVVNALERMTSQSDEHVGALYDALTLDVFESLLSKISEDKKYLNIMTKLAESIGKYENEKRNIQSSANEYNKLANKLAVFMSVDASLPSSSYDNDIVDTSTILALTEKFVNSGANINGKYNDKTALDYALQSDLHDVVRYLQEEDKNATPPKVAATVTLESDVDKQNEYLLSAIENRFPKYVYDTYALVKDKPKKYQFHEAFNAALKTEPKQPNVMIEFLRRGIPVPMVGVTAYFYSVYYSVIADNTAFVQNALSLCNEKELDINIDVLIDGRSCLYHAIKNKNLKIVKQQCEGKYSHNNGDKDAAHHKIKKHASHMNDAKDVAGPLPASPTPPSPSAPTGDNNDTNIDDTSSAARFTDGRSVLSNEIRHNNTTTIKTHINKGANINRIDKHDLTAIELAQNLHHYEIENYLLNLRTCCFIQRGWDRKDKKCCSIFCGRTYLTDQSTTAWLLIIAGLILFTLGEMEKGPVEDSPHFWIIICLQVVLIIGYLVCFCLAGCNCRQSDVRKDTVHEIDKKYDLNKQNLFWEAHQCIKEDVSCKVLFHNLENVTVDDSGRILLDSRVLVPPKQVSSVEEQSKKFWCNFSDNVEEHTRGLSALTDVEKRDKRIEMLNNLIVSQKEWKKVPKMDEKHYFDLPYYLLLIMILKKDTDGFNKILGSAHIFKPNDKFNKIVFPNKRSLLYYAIYYENVNAVEALCLHGAEMDMLDENKITARELARNMHQKNKKGDDDIDEDLETYGGVLERDVLRFSFKWQFAIGFLIFIGTALYRILKLEGVKLYSSSSSQKQNTTMTASPEPPSNAMTYLPVFANELLQSQDFSTAYSQSVHTQSLPMLETQPDMNQVESLVQLLKKHSHTFFNGFVYLKVEGLSNTHNKVTDYPMEVVALAKKRLEAERS